MEDSKYCICQHILPEHTFTKGDVCFGVNDFGIYIKGHKLGKTVDYYPKFCPECGRVINMPKVNITPKQIANDILDKVEYIELRYVCNNYIEFYSIYETATVTFIIKDGYIDISRSFYAGIEKGLLCTTSEWFAFGAIDNIVKYILKQDYVINKECI